MPLPPPGGPASRPRPRPGPPTEPVAIVGLSFEFPGGCDTPDAFWQALNDRRNTASEAPKDRYSADSLWHPDGSRRGTVAFRGGHYLTRDLAKFDAPFFNISDTEAAALDPQQRGLLETTFRALENGRLFALVSHVSACMANIYHSSGPGHGSSSRVAHLRLHWLLYRRLEATQLQGR